MTKEDINTIKHHIHRLEIFAGHEYRAKALNINNASKRFADLKANEEFIILNMLEKEI